MNTVRFVSKEHILIWNWESGTRNREPGTGNWLLVLYLSKRLGYFKIIDREQGVGNREPGTGSLFLILVCYTNISKVQIGNKEPVPGSFLIIILFILVSVYVLFISM